MRMLLSLIFCLAIMVQTTSRTAFAQAMEEPVAPQSDVCAFIAAAKPGFYGDYLRDFTQRQGWVDANNDGSVEYAALVADGSAHMTGIMLSQDGSILPELSMRYEADKEEFFLRGWGLRDQQWLNYQGTTYLLGMLGGSNRLVQYVWTFTPDYSGEKICQFDIHKHVRTAHPTEQAIKHFKGDATLTEESLNGLCQKIAKQETSSYLSQKPMERMDFGGGTYSEASIMADIDNDGQEEKLLYAHHASGAGPGCDGTFLLREGDAPLLRQDTPDALPPLYTAQNVDVTGPHPNCDRTANPRLLVYEGHTFLERGDLATPLRDARELYHELWYFKGEDAIPICRFNIEPDIRQVFP